MTHRRSNGGGVRSQQIRKLVEENLALRELLRSHGIKPDHDDLPFRDWAEPRRQSSESWDDIAAELSELMQTKISRETVRRWYTLP